MNNGQKSLSINETFIVEALEGDVLSACTGFYTNALVSCTGNTQILLGNNIIEANSAFSATTFYGDGSNLTGISTQDTFVTGGTYSNGTAIFTNNTGGTFNVTGFYTGATDVFVTGGTYFDGVTTFTNNTGGTFTIDGPSNYNAGIIFGAENWVDNNNGSIDLPEIKVALYDNPNNLELLKIYTVASGTTGIGGIPALANNDTNYIIVEYNGGSPRYNVLDNDGTVNSSDVVLYMIVYRANNFVHTLEFGDMGAGLPNKLNTRLISTDRFARESGCALGLSGSTGIVTLSSGVVWNGPYRQIVTAVNSQDDIFFKSFHSGGTWVYNTTGNTINNDYYDNGTDLVLATAGKYLVNWYFRGQEVNDHLYELISYGEFDTIQLAEASPEPNLPELITSHAFLVGRIIVEVSATTGITQSAFNTVFQPSGAPVLHNDLAGIQGGVAGEYYHLDSNKYNNLALTNTDNNFSVGQSFNDGLTATTISATTYLNLPLDIRVTGGTYSNGISVFRNNTGGTFSVTGYSIATSGTTLYSTSPSTSNFNTSNSIFLGPQAGFGATNANASNFFGRNAGSGATNATYSNFFGFEAGYQATGAAESNFLGLNAGQGANNASNSNFLGAFAGQSATDASSSNFFGYQAGSNATNASSSNFLGNSAGYQATNANDSNFLGSAAGQSATDAYQSNFFGNSAGYEATNASNSNFLGQNTGYQATNANNSNFFGQYAGYQATNAQSSNFLGSEAGFQATGASFSNLFGHQAGFANSTSDSIGSNNIIIGTNITLSAGTRNSINLGGVLFGTGTYSATTGNPSLSAQTNGRIGIGVVNPTETLHVVGNTRIQGGLSATTISATTYQNLPLDSIVTSGTTLYSTNPSTNNFNTTHSIFLGSNAGNGATGASDSNFFGRQAGQNATNAYNSNFLGREAGSGATNANDSNFIGRNAGSGAINVTFSNFMGVSAGIAATNANSSNFLGFSAGNGAASANNSNFFGRNAGSGATSANDSNFLGQDAGRAATNASNSNFFGQNAGRGATNANQSNFLGNNAGSGATGASFSTFIGQNAGRAATNAINSNFIGYQAGSGATSALNSNFLGQAGLGATAANNSNFLGDSAGRSAISANNSNFLGLQAGLNATNASQSNFLGQSAGFSATSANNSNFLGTDTGFLASSANNSNFLGVSAGRDATNANNSNFFGAFAGQSATNAQFSNFFGSGAGQNATGANRSNFIGQNAGQGATNAQFSNFIGSGAGLGATAANNSNFLGNGAGNGATNASNSNFLGQSAGNGATNASASNFISANAGRNATNANGSNFFGVGAGAGATNAQSSNFFGQSAGAGATGASFSTLIGYQAGFANLTSNSIGSNNIIIGTNITLSAGTTNSLNIGNVLYGTNTYSDSSGNPSFTPQVNGRIGIGVVIPQETLHVSGNTRVDGRLSATTISATTYLGISTQDTFVTGGTYSNGTAVFRNNTGGTFNVTGLTTPFTGGTVSGVTNFTGGLGVGVAVPTTRLHISGATAGDSGLRLETLTSVTPVSLGQAIGVDGNGNVVTINNVSGSTGPRPITTVIADTTLTDLDQVVIVNSTTPITITLPQITISGRLITIKNINTGVETILPYSGQLIDGDTSVVVARRNVSLDFQSYNNNWYII